MPLKGEATARKLREEVRAITRGVPMRWVSVRKLSLRHPDLSEVAIDQAISVAISRRWMLSEGNPPHSVCLTDVGRRTK